MTTDRPTKCRYCGGPLPPPKATGSWRQFCCDQHRRAHADLMRPLWSVRPPLEVPLLLHSADAEKRLRSLHAELRSTTRTCYALANVMERTTDDVSRCHLNAAGQALERVLGEHFACLEPKP